MNSPSRDHAPADGDAHPRVRPAKAQAIDAASKTLAEQICRDWGDEGEEMSPQEVAADLREFIAYESNGYQFAKRLEDRKYWSGVDAALVEILDCAWSILEAEHAKLVKAWVAENDIAFPFEVGQRVRTRYGVGVVVETNDYNLAKAQVCVRTPDQADNQSWVVNYEDAEPLTDGAPLRQDETDASPREAKLSEGMDT